jgi:ferredoxin-NADP reductase
MEILYWLQDLREHLPVSRRRRALRQPGQGADYTAGREPVWCTIDRLHPKRMRLRVTEVRQETASTKTFRFKRIDGPLPPFRPGQYAGDSGGKKETLDLTVRDKAGGFVAPYLLNQVQVGDELETTGPAGCFYYEPLIDGTDLVFLAGGSGITPFMSILRDAFPPEGPQTPLRTHLLYGSRVPEDVLFGPELDKLSAKHPNFHYSLVISEPTPDYQGLTGFLTTEVIQAQVGDVKDKTFYICGPNLMYDLCLSGLAELGVPRHKIKRELYGPPDNVTREPGWPENLEAGTAFDVEVEMTALGERRMIRATAGEPLLNSLERYGLVVPAICRAGECSACRTRLIAGRVFQPATTGLRESDREHGYIHACVSYPLENLTIRI